jgi:hypothetical protein
VLLPCQRLKKGFSHFKTALNDCKGKRIYYPFTAKRPLGGPPTKDSCFRWNFFGVHLTYHEDRDKETLSAFLEVNIIWSRSEQICDNEACHKLNNQSIN